MGIDMDFLIPKSSQDTVGKLNQLRLIRKMFSRFQNVVKLIFVGTSAFMKSLQFGSDEKSEMLIFVRSCYKWFRGVRLLEIFKNALLKMKTFPRL